MKKRLITGAIFLSILLPLVIINTKITEILYLFLTMFVCFYSSFEVMRAGDNHNKLSNDGGNLKILKILIPIFSSIIAFSTVISTVKFCTLGLSALHYYLFNLFTYIISAFIILCALVVIPNTTIKDYGTCLIALTYGGLFMSYAFSIRYLTPININEKLINLNGTNCFLFVYTIIVITDSFAMLFGCKFGKHRLAPTISPKKSVEGAIAGLAGGMIFGILGAFLYRIVSFNSNHLLLIILITALGSIVISAAGQFGDLIESKIKRCFEIKDMGNILPGHGGILDRFDSLLFSGLIFYIIIFAVELSLVNWWQG